MKGSKYMSNSNITQVIDTVSTILTATNSIVESMSEGDRKHMNTLVNEVAIATSMDTKKVENFVHHFVRTTNLAFVQRGKLGGVVRGQKPVTLVKAGKLTKKTTKISK